MLQQDSDIALLILKHLQQEHLDPEEEEVLQAWMTRSDDNRGVMESLSDEANLDKQVQEYLAFRRSAAARRKEADVEMTPARRIVWYRYAAAAAVLILLSLTAYLWFSKDSDKPLAKTDIDNKQSQPAIPPGRDGAILTLADGKQIILDSAANGKLVEQGRSTVTHKDGQISYKETRRRDEKVVYHTMSTPRGRQYKLLLSDGTAIWLNAASSVTYPTLFAGPTREISITGEVYLEVAKDKSKPFIAHVANTSDIEVLGTRFAVNAYADEPFIKTTLLEGSVKVSADIQGKTVHTVLIPGEQSQVSHENQTVLKEANTEEATAFVKGFFYFNKADIKTVMRQLEKWYDIQVTFTHPVNNRTFEGEIERNLPLQTVLTILKRSGAQFNVEGNRVQVQ